MIIACPCGSGKKYDNCCGIYINKIASAPTPEALMRSRYVAFTQANIEYIRQTQRGAAADNFDAKEAALWAMRVEWIKLEVHAVSTHKNKATVEFTAFLKENGKWIEHHEVSEFYLTQGKWFYTNRKKHN